MTVYVGQSLKGGGGGPAEPARPPSKSASAAVRAYSVPPDSRISGACFVARKEKERKNGLGEGDKQEGEGRGVQCRPVKIP